MNNLTDAQFSYIAGFLDARGSISITKTQGSANRTPSYVLRIIFSASGAEGLETLSTFMEICGLGSLNHYKSKYGNMQHEWRLVSRECEELLQGILAHLVKKHDQAIIALEFIEILKEYRHGGRGYIVPDEIIEKKEVCYLALRIVKRLQREKLSPEFLLHQVPSELEVYLHNHNAELPE